MGIQPKGFASPGWVGDNPSLPTILHSCGFQYVADDVGTSGPWQPARDGALIRLPTDIAGPNGEAFFEAGTARGLTKAAIVRNFLARIEGPAAHVAYDHPYFAGREGLHIVERCIDAALERHGDCFATMGELLMSRSR